MKELDFFKNIIYALLIILLVMGLFLSMGLLIFAVIAGGFILAVTMPAQKGRKEKNESDSS